MIWRYYRLEQRVREAFLREAFPEYEDPDLRRLARALHSLPTYPHDVFCMMRYENLTYEQIAERLDISVRQVQIALARALGMMTASTERQKRKGW